MVRTTNRSAETISRIWSRITDDEDENVEYERWIRRGISGWGLQGAIFLIESQHDLRLVGFWSRHPLLDCQSIGQYGGFKVFCFFRGSVLEPIFGTESKV